MKHGKTAFTDDRTHLARFLESMIRMKNTSIVMGAS